MLKPFVISVAILVGVPVLIAAISRLIRCVAHVWEGLEKTSNIGND